MSQPCTPKFHIVRILRMRVGVPIADALGEAGEWNPKSWQMFFKRDDHPWIGPQISEAQTPKGDVEPAWARRIDV